MGQNKTINLRNAKVACKAKQIRKSGKNIGMLNMIRYLAISMIIVSFTGCAKKTEPITIDGLKFYPGYIEQTIEYSSPDLVSIKTSMLEEFGTIIQYGKWKPIENYPVEISKYNYIIFTSNEVSYRFSEYSGQTLIVQDYHGLPLKRKGYFAPKEVFTNGQEFLENLVDTWIYPSPSDIQKSVFTMVRKSLPGQLRIYDESALSIQQNIELHNILNMDSWVKLEETNTKEWEVFDFALETRDNHVFWFSKNDENIAVLVSDYGDYNQLSELFTMPLVDHEALSTFISDAISKPGPSESLLSVSFTQAFIGREVGFYSDQYQLWKEDYLFDLSTEQQSNIKSLLSVDSWKKLNYAYDAYFYFALKDNQGNTYSIGESRIRVETEKGFEYYQVESDKSNKSLDYLLSIFIPKSPSAKILALTFDKVTATGRGGDGPEKPDDTFTLSTTQASILKSKLNMGSWKQGFYLETRFGWGIYHVIYLPDGGYIYLMKYYFDHSNDLKNKTWIYIKLDPTSDYSNAYMYLAPLSVLENASDYIKSIAPK